MRSDIDIKRDVEKELRNNRRPDPVIARDAVSAIESELPYSSEHIRVVVRDGSVTLEGQVEWDFARERAELAVRRVRGVKGIGNLIQLGPRVEPIDIRRKIESFRRNAELDGGRITVETDGGVVRPKGTVRSWAERQDAERVASQAPGISP